MPLVPGGSRIMTEKMPGETQTRRSFRLVAIAGLLLAGMAAALLFYSSLWGRHLEEDVHFVVPQGAAVNTVLDGLQSRGVIRSRLPARGETGRFPETPSRGAPPLRHAVAGILRRRGRVLLVRRPPEGLLGGLYGFPGGDVRRGEPLETALARTVWEKTGVRILPGARVGTVHHTYSHFRLMLHLFFAEPTNEEESSPAVKWIWPSAMERYPLSGVDRKAAALVWCGRKEDGS